MERLPVASYSITITFGCDPDKVDEITNIINKEIERLKTTGPSPAELAKAKEKKFRERETDIKNNDFWLDKIKSFYLGNLKENDIRDFEKIVKNISEENIKLAANKYFNNSVRISLKPEQ